MYLKANKKSMLTMYDYDFYRIKNPVGNIVVVYLIVDVLKDGKKLEDAVHLHIDLPGSIDRNIFTDEFCDKLFKKLPDTFDVYYGGDYRVKVKDIDKLIELIKTV